MTAPGAIDWLTAAEFFLPNGLGAWMRKSGGLPVRRGGHVLGTVREALRRLRRGRTLGIFPEGGIRTGPGPSSTARRPCAGRRGWPGANASRSCRA